MKESLASLPLPLRNSLASGSLVEAWVSLARCSPWKSRSPLRPGAGGSPEPSFGRKLFIDAQAWISVPSTEKCSSDKSALTLGCASTARRNLAAISPSSSRSRFLVNTVTSQIASSTPNPTNQRNKRL